MLNKDWRVPINFLWHFWHCSISSISLDTTVISNPFQSWANSSQKTHFWAKSCTLWRSLLIYCSILNRSYLVLCIGMRWGGSHIKVSRSSSFFDKSNGKKTLYFHYEFVMYFTMAIFECYKKSEEFQFIFYGISGTDLYPQ